MDRHVARSVPKRAYSDSACTLYVRGPLRAVCLALALALALAHRPQSPRAMSTLTSTRPSTRPSDTSPPRARRKREQQPCSDIWTSLLRQTREAQARSRTSTLQHRALLLLGGSPDDQRNLVEKYVARPPPALPASRNQQQRDAAKSGRKGEVRLSNRFAYGYGHVTLFSPPTQQAGLLGGETEEVARVECHTFAGAAGGGYEETLRRLMRRKNRSGRDNTLDDDFNGGEDEGGDGKRPSICILLSWHAPWTFLGTLKRWFALIARALLPPEAPKHENAVEVLREHGINLTVVLQHVEAQEDLERENYKDDDFDYISQVLRTCLLPLSAGLVYTPTSPQPQQPGSPLNDVQKVLYTSLGLDIGALQPRTGRPGSSGTGGQAVTKKEDLIMPKYNVVDRMAIVVPSGWDSVGKIRLLSEIFSPEAMIDGWMADLEQAMSIFTPAAAATNAIESSQDTENEHEPATSGAAAMYSSQPSPTTHEPPLSPSKQPKSAIISYENAITNPQAHKAPKPPQLEVTTKPEQAFLAEMRTQLQQFEAQDRQQQQGGQATAAGAGSGEATGRGALSDLGDVSFNVGGVSYNTSSAEAAIERLKRPDASTPATTASPRHVTPRPPKRDGTRESSDASGGTPSARERGELQTDKLEEYFASLMKRGGGGSATSTPSKAPQ
ncbi:hypothetical protein LTR37_018134 [Vermiconidia calcicola]|uniref:Uncharacterized protein n=1 Tax=Vermiconidia calcicola TaxID=1690605 RepID=A0ACC3MHR8_9PEZI|nr:hypothetical protein LTR37_018134 [Vermiconidia calcicola]